MWHVYDENKVVVGEGYVVFGNSFDPSELSSFSAEQYKEQQELDYYMNSMPNRLIHYMSSKDT